MKIKHFSMRIEPDRFETQLLRIQVVTDRKTFSLERMIPDNDFISAFDYYWYIAKREIDKVIAEEEA